jgi:hypothetical protein
MGRMVNHDVTHYYCPSFPERRGLYLACQNHIGITTIIYVPEINCGNTHEDLKLRQKRKRKINAWNQTNNQIQEQQ